MAIIYDFKKKLAIDFGELIEKAVLPGDLLFGTPVAAPVATGKAMMVEITHPASGEKRTLVYNRANLATIFENITPGQLVLSLVDALTNTRDVAVKFGETYGVPIVAEDIVNTEITGGSYMLQLTAEPTSLAYEGKVTFLLFNGGAEGGLPPPVNDFKFKNDAKNSGTSGNDMTVAFNYTESHGRTWAHVPAGGAMLYGNNCKIKVCGDFTLDFEIFLDQSYGGYLYTFTNNTTGNGGSNTQGTLAFQARKLYEYMITPTQSGLWPSGVTTIPYGEPVRITIRSRNGYTSIWINGVMVITYPCLADSAQTYLTAFRNADASATQMPNGIGIANLRSWEVGLDNVQLDLLFGKAADPLKPRNSWALDGKNFDLGRDAFPWLAPMAYTTFGDKTWASSNSAAGAAIGTFLDVSRDYTLQFKLFNPTSSFADVEGMFTTATLADVNHAIKFCIGNVYLGGSTEVFTTRSKLTLKDQRTVTIRRTGSVYEAWIDEYYLGTATVPAHSTILTHFGKSVQALGTAWMLADIKFWDRSLSIAELGQLLGPNVQQPTLVVGMLSPSGNTQMIDGNYGTVFNATANPTAIGSLPAEHANKYVLGMQYHFANDSVNYLKKVKEIYLDKWENGAWVAKEGHYTHAARMNFPARECIVYESPTVINPNDLRIRFRAQTHWGDPNGYRWVTEMTLFVGEKPALLNPWVLSNDTVTGVTGDTTLLDGNLIWTLTPYAAAREGVVEATLPPACVGLALKRLYLRFLTDAANWDKKAKYVCVDTWENGAWVEKVKVTTALCSLNAPQNEVINLVTPIVFANQKIRLRCSGNNGNASGIVSMADITPFFGAV